ncbi:MAG: response regulator [Acidobacteriota bacterium]
MRKAADSTTIVHTGTNAVNQYNNEVFDGNETILIVEDEKELRELLSALLISKGYRVYEACDGQEGVEQFARHKDRIDLVVCDVGLPRMNGYAAFSKMKELSPSVRVLLISGFFDPALNTSAAHSDAISYIQKPYTPKDMLLKVRQMLDRS